MTLHELSQCYWLDKEVEVIKEQIRRLEASISGVQSPIISDMPRGPRKAVSRTEQSALQLVDLRERLSEAVAEYTSERVRLEEYIANIPDSLTRLIFRKRFIEGLTWRGVADAVGGNNTEDGVRKTCRRYLARSEEADQGTECTKRG